MPRLLFAAFFVVLTLLTGTEGSKPKISVNSITAFCFPDNATKARCFSGFPNAAHTSSSWLSWFMPSADDAYDLGGVQTFDAEDFAITRIEENPTYFCQHRDKFADAMVCMGKSARSKCPFLPASMFDVFKKLSDDFQYICSRMPEMDPTCIHNHWSSMKPCKRKVVHDIVSAAMNASATSKYSPANTTSTFGNGTKSGNSSASQFRKAVVVGLCYFHYKMTECVKESMSMCDATTQHIMIDFFRNHLSSQFNCSQQMEKWDADKQPFVSDCKGDHCSGAVPNVSLTMFTFVMPALVLMKMTC